jgi:hypothetical protein
MYSHSTVEGAVDWKESVALENSVPFAFVYTSGNEEEVQEWGESFLRTIFIEGNNFLSPGGISE